LNNQELLKKFYSRLIAIEQRSPLTAETYKLEVRRFLEFLEAEGLEVSGVNSFQISSYLQCRRKQDHIDSRSAAKAISCLRSFYRFVMDEGLRKDNPAALLEIPRRSMRIPQVLSREAVERLLAAADIRTPTGLRNRAIYELIYSAGLRVSEAVGLNIKDLDLGGGVAKVCGKGKKERLVVFGPEAVSWLKRYLAEARPPLAGKRPSSAVFIGRTGKRLSRKGIWKNYTRYTIAAGTGSKLHSLRHSFATELLAGGADLRSVQELLGHTDITTTQIYTHVDVSLLRESHRKFLPKLKDLASGKVRDGDTKKE
jgi:integrase/recombinase XerD